MKGITIRVEDEKHMKLKLACIKKGTNITAVMTDLLDRWVEHVESEDNNEK